MSTYKYKVSHKPATAPDDVKAHHVKDHNGKLVRFMNPFPSYGPDIWFPRIWFNLFRARFQGKLPTPDTSNVHVPIVTPSLLPPHRISTSLRTTWIGHATIFVEFPSGFRALFDPVFEDQCMSIGPKRFTPPACKPTDLPSIDAVFISHNHSDHLSYPSIQKIVACHPQVHFFVPLGVAKWFQDSGIASVTEMDWWEDTEVLMERISSSESTIDEEEVANISAHISCLPTQHGSLRTPFDRDRTLWCSWAITSGSKSVWFAGDTGYRHVHPSISEMGPGFSSLPRNPQFAQIGDLRGPFDVGLIPIGAYQPREIWSPIHSSPLDAVEIMLNTNCRRAIGIHWGTWALTSEAVEEPPEKLREALISKGIAETGVFDVCAVGESREF